MGDYKISAFGMGRGPAFVVSADLAEAQDLAYSILRWYGLDAGLDLEEFPAPFQGKDYLDRPHHPYPSPADVAARGGFPLRVAPAHFRLKERWYARDLDDDLGLVRFEVRGRGGKHAEMSDTTLFFVRGLRSRFERLESGFARAEHWAEYEWVSPMTAALARHEYDWMFESDGGDEEGDDPLAPAFDEKADPITPGRQVSGDDLKTVALDVNSEDDTRAEVTSHLYLRDRRKTIDVLIDLLERRGQLVTKRGVEILSVAEARDRYSWLLASGDNRSLDEEESDAVSDAGPNEAATDPAEGPYSEADQAAYDAAKAAERSELPASEMSVDAPTRKARKQARAARFWDLVDPELLSTAGHPDGCVSVIYASTSSGDANGKDRHGLGGSSSFLPWDQAVWGADGAAFQSDSMWGWESKAYGYLGHDDSILELFPTGSCYVAWMRPVEVTQLFDSVTDWASGEGAQYGVWLLDWRLHGVSAEHPAVQALRERLDGYGPDWLTAHTRTIVDCCESTDDQPAARAVKAAYEEPKKVEKESSSADE